METWSPWKTVPLLGAEHLGPCTMLVLLLSGSCAPRLPDPQVSGKWCVLEERPFSGNPCLQDVASYPDSAIDFLCCLKCISLPSYLRFPREGRC